MNLKWIPKTYVVFVQNLGETKSCGTNVPMKVARTGLIKIVVRGKTNLQHIYVIFVQSNLYIFYSMVNRHSPIIIHYFFTYNTVFRNCTF